MRFSGPNISLERSPAIECDATRMDQHGVAALLRLLGVPLAEPVGV